jgi:hypothetical protein
MNLKEANQEREAVKGFKFLVIEFFIFYLLSISQQDSS